jgi:hypothetical protein
MSSPALSCFSKVPPSLLRFSPPGLGLDRQREEMKQEVAFAASTPEWKGYDKEVVDAIASIEDQWLVSDEPITKTNVEKLHRFISETVVSIREKWVERLDKRERVWTAFPQKADIHDPELSSLGTSVTKPALIPLQLLDIVLDCLWLRRLQQRRLVSF